MAYTLAFSSKFQKQYRKLTAQQRIAVQGKLRLLAENTMHPSLRVKRIRGKVGLWEMSVNMDIRIIWQYNGDTLILLLDIGHHDILKRY